MDIKLYPKAGNNTAAIQNAIDECFLAGGGTVTLTAGLYTVGSVRLRSCCTLYLCSGAILKGTRDPADYRILRGDTVEPVDEAYYTDAVWAPAKTRKIHDHLTKAGSSWNNAVIRLLRAHDAAVIGEQGAIIDGSDCYDAIGEEHYRGPHGISFHDCRDLVFRGYTIRNTGNWAHQCSTSQRLSFSDITIEGGHDGIHMSSCDDIDIHDCKMFTGDDCVAGFDNRRVHVHDCELNTACSAFRFGGTDVLIENCHMYGPAKYFFRGSLSLEDKISGNTAPTVGRKTMLGMFTYYADSTLKVRSAPKNIVMRNCTLKDAMRFILYDFSGAQVWQMGKPLEEITFENVTAQNVDMPLDLYGDAEKKHTVHLKSCRIGFTSEVTCAIRAAHFERIAVENTAFENVNGPLIRSYGDTGEIAATDVTGVTAVLTETDEPYVSKGV